jgi:hypothetical protein
VRKTHELRSQGPTKKQRPRHHWPICEATGRVRLGELKDARLALEHAAHARWAANMTGKVSRRRELRACRCSECHGYHLTAWPAPTSQQAQRGVGATVQQHAELMVAGSTRVRLVGLEIEIAPPNATVPAPSRWPVSQVTR